MALSYVTYMHLCKVEYTITGWQIKDFAKPIQPRPIWVRREVYGRPSTVATDMKETLAAEQIFFGASQSYNIKLWFKRLNHISLNGGPRLSLVPVSFGSVWCSHIRHPRRTPRQLVKIMLRVALCLKISGRNNNSFSECSSFFAIANIY